MTDTTCSGARIQDVRRKKQYRGELVPQIAHDFSSAGLVTITIGGNDLGFADIATDCFFKGKCRKRRPPGKTDKVSRKIKRLVPQLFDLYSELAAKVPPDTTITVLGYPLFIADPNDIFEPAAPCLTHDIHNYVSPEDARWIRAKIEELNRAIEETVGEVVRISGRANLVYVDVSNALRCHEVCQPRPWVTQFGLGQGQSVDVHLKPPFHPNQYGHEELARCLANALAGTPACGQDQKRCF